MKLRRSTLLIKPFLNGLMQGVVWREPQVLQ